MNGTSQCMPQVKLRLCACCKESKPSRCFSHITRQYAAHCKECGVWLRLLRQHFGPTRDILANREKCRLRAIKKRCQPVALLWAAWMGEQA